MHEAQSDIEQLTASDGYRLNYRHWKSNSEKPRGYVVALHGIQSHSGWYEYSSSRLCQSGYDVWFLDRRGSGLNHEARGDTPHQDRLINDVVQFLSHLRHVRKHAAPASPVILLGVSWGGKLAAVTTAKRPELVDALALLYPGICANVKPSLLQRWQLCLAELLGVREKLVPIPLDDPELFTGERQWQEFIRDDHLALHEITVSFLLANRQLDRFVEQTPARIHCPILLMLAGQDRIIDNVATRKYYERLTSQHRKLIEYPKAQHTLEFEPNRNQIVDDLIDWLNEVRPIC